MAELRITPRDMERAASMAYLESGSIPVADRVRDFRQVLMSMVTRGQLFANGMAGEQGGYGRLTPLTSGRIRGQQVTNTGFDDTPIQRSLAALNAYEPLRSPHVGANGDLSQLPAAPPIYRELAAQLFRDIQRDPSIIDIHTDYGNPVVVADRVGGENSDAWRRHWLYGVSQNADQINGAGSPHRHAHGTMTGVQLPSAITPVFDENASGWINTNSSIDGLTTDEIIRQPGWSSVPDLIPSAGTDGYGDGVDLSQSARFVPPDYNGPYTAGVDIRNFVPNDYTDTTVDQGGPRRPNEFGPSNTEGPSIGQQVGDALNAGSDAFTRGLEGLGRGALDLSGQALDGVRGLFPGAQPPAAPVDNGARGVDINSQSFAQTFDARAYLDQNQDVRAAGIDPLQHFRQYGAAEGRQAPRNIDPYGAPYSGNDINPNGPGGFAANFQTSDVMGTGSPSVGDRTRIDPVAAARFGATPQGGQSADINSQSFAQNFNPRAYLDANPDVRAAGIGPLVHFRLAGAAEGRQPTLIDPSAPFSQANVAQGAGATGYGTFNGDLAQRGQLPMGQASIVGSGPAVSGLPPGFSEQAYYAANPDVQAAGVPAAQHYLVAGRAEGRPIGVTDGSTISAPPAQQSVSNLGMGTRVNSGPAAFGLGSGAAVSGLSAGAAVSGLPPGFSEAAYYAANPDVQAAGVPAAQHYLVAGRAEGRPIGAMDGSVIDAGPAIRGLSPTFGSPVGSGAAASGIAAPSASSGLPPGFSEVNYYRANPDVQAAGVPAGQHYLVAGRAEGRNTGTLDFSGPAPVNDYGFSSANVGGFNGGGGRGSFGSGISMLPLEQAQTIPPNAAITGLAPGGTLSPIGSGEAVRGLDPGAAVAGLPPGFSDQGYYRANPDVQAAGVPAAQHYLVAGRNEGRNIGELDFSGANVSGGVGFGSFGSAPAMPAPSFSALATAGGFGSQGNIASAVNLGMGGTGFRADSYNPTWDRPGFSGYAGSTRDATGAPMNGATYGDGGAIQAQNSAQSQSNYFAIEANNRAIAEAQNAVAANNVANIGNPFGVEQLVVAQPFNPSGVASQGFRVEPAQAIQAPRINMPAQAQASNYAGPIGSSYASAVSWR